MTTNRIPPTAESTFTAPADRLRRQVRGLLIAALSARDFSRSAGCATDPELPYYRILFALEKDLIFIHLVKDRKDAYRD